jgi:exosortase A-associated hydrolase 2
VKPFFFGAGESQRFGLYREPMAGPIRGTVLVVHAFAEEMNKTRAAVADGARALSESGYAVLQIDLLGCGDSAGDFGDATWSRWLADLGIAWNWLAERSDGPRWVWGVRFGALLADEFAAACSPSADGLLFWQPVVNGAQFLNQFLRLKSVGETLRATAGSPPAAAGLAPGDQAPTSTRDRLVAGESVEVAGYWLSSSLAMSIDSARLGKQERPPRHVHWFQVSPRDGVGELNPVALRLVNRWRGAGVDVRLESVVGPPFWQTLETERSPALVQRTVESMR